MDVKGVDQLKKKLRELGKVDRRVPAAVGLVAQSVANEYSASIRTGGAGAGSGGKHIPSEPGQPPHSDTGTLLGGVFAAPISADGLEWIAGNNVEYAPYLEFGTSRMSARPALFPAYLKNVAQGKKIIGAAVAASVRKAAR